MLDDDEYKTIVKIMGLAALVGALAVHQVGSQDGLVLTVVIVGILAIAAPDVLPEVLEWLR